MSCFKKYLDIVARAFQACGVAVVICIGNGIISDIFSDHEQGQAYGIFIFGREAGGAGGVIGSSVGALLIYPNVALLVFNKVVMTITLYIQNLLLGDLLSAAYPHPLD
ncbi:8281_t:CDS:2 [Funneliformis geosporum]|uniref:760_t:CDS:1 n=1 Tax=Funneliformis geosporum TaxID=1117311 RepID=A0A9W4SW79_9GLOM|nr:760_t:CDS:2 [Funneliformis geosporum]CAI2185594.1 8281_t:CDS:2 [Funneliformis geosporum]